MPLLFQYIIKVSCGLAIVYVFYLVVLRRLTFYQANRWYLLLLPALCFLLPFIDVSGYLNQQQLAGSGVVHIIPAVSAFTGSSTPLHLVSISNPLPVWETLMAILVLGSFFFFLRLVVQYWSFTRIRKQARLLTGGGVNIYEVDKAIIPFSFGKAIFINPALHSEAELKDIIRHEFVHVKQRHSLDIIWTELLCIFSWFNPFAWLLRHAVRQNLEFIADTNVLESGVDKKQYQYILLKVIGIPEFRIATSFNLSSLKKRIIMMNRNKSTRVHLLWFLFVLPLVAVVLLAFRNNTSGEAENKELTLSGIVVNAHTLEPLKGASIKDRNTGIGTHTDARGFYTLVLPLSGATVSAEIYCYKEGYQQMKSASLLVHNSTTSVGTVEIIGLALEGTDQKNAFVTSIATSGTNPSVDARPDYTTVKKLFDESNKKSVAKAPAEQKPRVFVIQARTMRLSSDKKNLRFGNKAQLHELDNNMFMAAKNVDMDVAGLLPLLNGEPLEATKTYTLDATQQWKLDYLDAPAKNESGGGLPVLQITILPKSVTDTIPDPTVPPSGQLPVDYKAFLKRNPAVQDIHFRNDSIYVNLKSGGADRYANSKSGIKKLEQKYGPLPVPPLPPPPPPLPPKTTVPPEPES
jgi:beta-lactamase regulating signal transducer with metallopeptidase domain